MPPTWSAHNVEESYKFMSLYYILPPDLKTSVPRTYRYLKHDYHTTAYFIAPFAWNQGPRILQPGLHDTMHWGSFRKFVSTTLPHQEWLAQNAKNMSAWTRALDFEDIVPIKNCTNRIWWTKWETLGSSSKVLLKLMIQNYSNFNNFDFLTNLFSNYILPPLILYWV